MLQIRIHGRGGQGVVTAAEMLSIAAFARGPPCAGVPELRLRAHRRAGGRVLPHRRPRDPPARADPRARRADHPGPDAAAPGRRLRRASRADGYVLINTQAQLRRARPRRDRRSASGRERLLHRPGDRARAASTSGGRCRTRRCSAASPRSPDWSRSTSVAHAIRDQVHAARSPTATSPRRPRPTRSFVKRRRGVAHAQADSKARTPSPRPWRCAGPRSICAYPISPQTHIVEGLGEMVKSGALAPCEFINVESRVRRDVVAIGASADRRAHLHRHRQPGPAVHGRGGLQRLRARPADRDDGRQPRHRRADQHLERPQRRDGQRDAGWIQLFAETNQEALDLHIQAFRLAEELSLPVMVCMDGFILTHAFERVDMPDAGPGRRLPAALRAAPGARSGRSGLDRRHGRARGVHGGALPRARQAAAALERIPQHRRRVRRRASAATRAGWCAPTAARTPRPSSSPSARCSARSRTPSTSCATRACAIGVLGIHVVPPVPARRRARGAAAARSASSCSRRASRRPRRHRLDRRPHGPVGPAAARLHGDRRPRRPRDHARRRSQRMLREAVADELRAAHLPRPRLAHRRARARARGADAAQRARSPRTCCATSAPSPRDRLDAMDQHVKFYQTGTLHGRQPPARAGAAHRAGRSIERSNSLTSGHRACQGCGEALGARYALDAAMRATGGQLIAVNATGCLEVFSTPYPETSWQMPWLHSLFGNAAAVATGVAAALRGARARERRARRRPGRRRRHDRHRLRLPVGHVRAQRRRALHLLRQRGLHEHRRAALRRHAAGGAHGDHDGRRAPSPGNAFGTGQERAADRDGARDPVRRHRDRRRPARPGGQGRRARWRSTARATCTSSCPARSAGARRADDTIQIARLAARDRPLPGLRGRARRGHRASRRSAAACRSRSTCGRRSASPTCSAPTGDAGRCSRGSRPIADRNIARFGLLDEESAA